MADALASGASEGNLVGVQVPPTEREYLALPGGVAQLRAGGTAGLPLLAPWANRLAYATTGPRVCASISRGLPLGTDSNGLPIHGLLVGAPGWRVDRADVRGRTARLGADPRRCAGVPVPTPDRGWR